MAISLCYASCQDQICRPVTRLILTTGAIFYILLGLGAFWEEKKRGGIGMIVTLNTRAIDLVSERFYDVAPDKNTSTRDGIVRTTHPESAFYAIK